MNENMFAIILALIPVLGAIVTGFVIPYIKSKTSANQLETAISMVEKAVRAAEVLFDTPQSGEEKREYVIGVIDKMFNSKKEIISKEQIRILLESAWLEMKQN